MMAEGSGLSNTRRRGRILESKKRHLETLCVCVCRSEHDMGTLLWLHVKTLERAPTAFFGGLVRCAPPMSTILFLCIITDITERHTCMWQSIELEYYAVVYFELITEFEPL